ncbi:MAG: cytochrome-c oxidase, cbb3-type subunit III [Alphaproteobacteria bacterium]
MTSDNDKNEIDPHSGVETTGHEWDGIKELNNPAPRWWLWVFYITIIWSIGYWVVYPAWPTLSGEGTRGGTEGAFNWTQYKKLKEEQSEIVARKSQYLDRFSQNAFEQIANDPELYAFAVAGGKAAFKDNCATCHGSGGAGAKGYPNLNDDDWIWGGSLESVYQTLQYGIRSGHDETRENTMPAFGEGLLSKAEISDVAHYVYAISHTGDTKVAPDVLTRGAKIFEEQCAACHAPKGQGNPELGAPRLNDAIWLYGEGSVEGIIQQVSSPRHGVMPAWKDRLDEDTIRQLSIYIHSLGGGQ